MPDLARERDLAPEPGPAEAPAAVAEEEEEEEAAGGGGAGDGAGAGGGVDEGAGAGEGAGVGAGPCASVACRRQRWLSPLPQSHCWMRPPAATLKSFTSRHLPVCLAAMWKASPLAVTAKRWFAPAP